MDKCETFGTAPASENNIANNPIALFKMAVIYLGTCSEGIIYFLCSSLGNNEQFSTEGFEIGRQ